MNIATEIFRSWR